MCYLFKRAEEAYPDDEESFVNAREIVEIDYAHIFNYLKKMSQNCNFEFWRN